MKKWAVFSDVDGTIYGFPDKKLLEKNKNKILELERKNIPFVINTGNGPFQKIQRLADTLKTRYIICGAGSAIYDNLEKKFIHVEYIDQEHAKQIFDIANKNNISLYYFGINQYYLHNHTIDMKEFLTDFCEYDEWITTGVINKDLYKIEIYGNYKQVKLAYKKLCEVNLDQKLTIMYMVSHIEIVKKNIDKGSGLKWVSENLLGINVEDVMAIGDSRNDVEMLKIAGYSYAMDNADNDTKKYAKYYTSDVHQAGLAEAIDDYLYRTDYELKRTVLQKKKIKQNHK